MFRVLGGVAVEVDGEVVPLQAQPQRLLGVLLAGRGQIVPTELIVERLWARDAPKTAVKVVQVLVGRLRRVIAPGDDVRAHAILVTEGHGYGVVDADVDIDTYLRLVDDAERLAAHDLHSARTAAEAAIAQWTGRPWGDQADEEWLQPIVEMLEERHRRAEELWADLVLRGGGSDLPLERLTAAALAQPLRERRWSNLMLALYRSGRQADALRAYEQARTILREDLGIEPGPELRRLQLNILQHDPALAEVGPSDTAAPTSFVGRDADLRRLDDALGRSRFVTVLGLGGMGKSRLALEYLHRRRLSGARVGWASLSGLSDPARLPQHVAAATGVHFDDAPSATAALVASADRAHMLLVLDGAEHAVNDVAQLALRLLEECPRLRVLVTSRVPIGLTGERTVQLGPLELSTAEGAVSGTALELLLDRLSLDAAALDAATRERLSAVCRESAGVPLLVELLASSVDLAEDAPGAIVTDGFRSHHDVVRDAIAHAMHTVDVVPRELVRAMSTLPAGVNEHSAAALLDLSEDAARRALRLLAWTHLVDAEVGRASLRYRSLDPVREVLAAELDERERALIIDRAADAMGAALRAVRLPGLPASVAALEAIDDEHDNLRFLLADRLATAPADALELAIPASEFWPFRGHIVEGRQWLRRGIDAAQPTGELRWRAVVALARTTRTFGEVAEMGDELEAVVAEMRTADPDVFVFGTGLLYLTMARGWRGDRRGAGESLAEAEELDGRIGTPWTRAHVDQLREMDRTLGGDLLGARDGMRRFGRTMESLNDPIGAAMGWYLAATMGDMANRDDIGDDIARGRELAETHGDISLLNQLIRIEARLLQRVGDPAAKERLRDAAERLVESGGLRAGALARLDVALVDLGGGDDAAALAELRQAVPMLLHLDRPGAALGVAALAVIADTRGDVEVCRALVAAALSLDAGEHSVMPTDRVRMQLLLEPLPPPASSPAGSEGDPAAVVVGALDAAPLSA